VSAPRLRSRSATVGIALAVGAALVMGPGASAGTVTGGTRLWGERYNGPGNDDDQASSVAASPDGSKVFVTGFSIDTLGGFYDYATIAYDASTGAELWTKRYDGPTNGYDLARSVAASPDGSKVFVTGFSDGGPTSFDYVTIAYDALTGAKVWLKRYTGPGESDSHANSIAASPDGSKVFVTGESGGGASGRDYATVAYDASTGVKVWAKRYDGPANDDDIARSAAVSPDGSAVFVTGESSGSPHLDYATVAYDASSGGRLWVARYDGPGSGYDAASSLTAIPDGSGVVVTGTSEGITSRDYATVAYDASTGGELWTKRYDGPADRSDGASSIGASPAASTVFVTGRSTGTGTGTDFATVAYDSSTGARVWARRYDGTGSGDDFANSLAASADGSKVFVTGFSIGTPDSCFCATVAYDASTGARLWWKRHHGPSIGDRSSNFLAASPDGSKVFVTGSANQPDTFRYDYLTVAYAA